MLVNNCQKVTKSNVDANAYISVKVNVYLNISIDVNLDSKFHQHTPIKTSQEPSIGAVL